MGGKKYLRFFKSRPFLTYFCPKFRIPVLGISLELRGSRDGQFYAQIPQKYAQILINFLHIRDIFSQSLIRSEKLFLYYAAQTFASIYD